MAKSKSKEERYHYAKLTDFGCIVCHIMGYGFSSAECHHIKSGNAGAGMKSHWSLTIPLCPQHHRLGGYGVAVHAGKLKFEENFGTEVELLNTTLNLLDGSV
jgi:hypothetical protein